MSDLNKVVQLSDFKVTVSHTSKSVNLNYNTPYFSEVEAYFSEQRRDKKPVKRYHTLKSLVVRLHTANAQRGKGNSIAILKGIYKGGTSGQYCTSKTPFLFFDVDVKKDKENTHLLNAKANADVFDQLKNIALLVWRSNSKKGMAGILYVPSLAEYGNDQRNKHLSAGKAITTYISEKLGVYVSFDPAQSKFRQYRYLADQYGETRVLNKTPYTFTHVLKEIPKVSRQGAPQYSYTGGRAVLGSVKDQFNRDNPIDSALLQNTFQHLSRNRYKHPSTTSKSTGHTKEDVFFNHSTSFSLKPVFSSFDLYLRCQYNNDFKAFISDLKSKGYEDKKPPPNVLKKAQKELKQSREDRQKQIFKACYDLRNLPYKQKQAFAKDNANDDNELVLFYDYLKLKPLTIAYDKTIVINNFVSEGIAKVLDYTDQHNKTILTAETGTGKTTAFLKNFKQHRPGKRLLIVAPLTIIVNQTAEQYENVTCLTGSSDSDDHTRAKVATVVMATYEQGTKHLQGAHSFNYVVIDESHNLINANSFKRKAIQDLTAVLNGVKVIGLTGTPNLLFKPIGFKLCNIKKRVQKKVNVIMRKDNRNSEKVILQHLEKVRGKCVIRVNSRNVINEVKAEVIKKGAYNENEILLLYSENEIKNGTDFQHLSGNSCFLKGVRLILTTSLIDEGLSIEQEGFSDVVFIENEYHPNPEPVKQFFARFRNEDQARKNYYYFKETNNQTPNAYNPFFDYSDTYKELKEDIKGRVISHTSGRDMANTDKFFYPNGIIYAYGLANEISNQFFKALTTAEYIVFLEINYNLKISKDKEYDYSDVNINEIKKNKELKAKTIYTYWTEQKDDILNALFTLTNNKDIKNSLEYNGEEITQQVHDIVYAFKYDFEKLYLYDQRLQGLGIENTDPYLIDNEKQKPRDQRQVNRAIILQENVKTITTPKTGTDERNKTKMQDFISDAKELGGFTSTQLLKLWKKQRCTSRRIKGENLIDLVNYFTTLDYDKKTRVYRVTL